MKKTRKHIPFVAGFSAVIVVLSLFAFNGLNDREALMLQDVYLFKLHDFLSPGQENYKDSPYNERSDIVNLSTFVTDADYSKSVMELPQPLPDFKNPCWLETVSDNFSYYSNNLYYEYHKSHPKYSMYTAWEDKYAEMQNLIDERKNNASGKPAWRMRCFPYFFLIGFTKCGTTDLHHVLSLVPGFFKGLTKEPEFWNRILIINDRDVHLPKPTISGYLDLFDLAAEGIRNYVIRGENNIIYHPGITGDLDPHTIWRITDWRKIKGNENASEPKYLPVDQIYRLRPRSKFIVALRNPVERTFSYYKVFALKDQPFDPEIFHREMEEIIKNLELCFKERSVRSCIYLALIPRFVGKIVSAEAIVGSFYHVFIGDWLKLFPREQFLFIKSEDYFKNRTAVITDVLKFLEIGNSIPQELSLRLQNISVINRSEQLEMWNKTRDLLENFFHPTKEQLFAQLQDKKFLWN